MRRYRSVRSHRRGVRHLDARARPEDGGKRRDCDHESKRDVSAHGEPPSVASTESAGGTSRLRSYRDLRESCVKRITDLLKLGKPEVACRVHPWTLEQAERVLNTGSTLRFTPSRRGRACPGLDPGSRAKRAVRGTGQAICNSAPDATRHPRQSHSSQRSCRPARLVNLLHGMDRQIRVGHYDIRRLPNLRPSNVGLGCEHTGPDQQDRAQCH